ncbi:MAG: hypothetical protein J3Q66DRAFT_330730 [Benniella sp.]|nr:MAG: hypothetical protein J3Q66DRAFT_330730 [Benniella sp.]
MQENAQHRVFALSELVTLIAQYLSPRDISRWMMTSKTFSRRLEPFFWSHPVLGNCNQHSTSLVQYACHFLSLEARSNLKLSPTQAAPSPESASHALATLPEYPRLRKFTIHAHESIAFLSLYSHLVLHSPNLTELNLQYGFKSDSLSMEHYLKALATTLPCLQRLTIKYKSTDTTTAFRLLEVCFAHPQLTDLQCDFFVDEDHCPAIEYDIYDPRFAALVKSLRDKDKANADAGQPTGLRLKSLSLPDLLEGYPTDFLIPFLGSYVPKLERLCIPRVNKLDEADVRRLEEAIEIGCPRLQHLSSNWNNSDDESDEGWKTFISVLRGCTKAGLRTYQTEFFKDDFFSQGSITEKLLLYHGETLEEIEFPECFRISSRCIQSILATCRNLRKFRMEPYSELPCDLHFRDVLTEWVCRDITVLDLRLERQVDVPEGRSEGEVMAEAAQRVYSQIGRLVKLEDLRLYYYEHCGRVGWLVYDLMLEIGWLGELAGLKNLRHFGTDSHNWDFMGPAEVEFMDTNWPKLQSITSGGVTSLYGSRSQMDLWNRMKERRPYIVYNEIDPHGIWVG